MGVQFKKGLSTTLPATRNNETFYITTDTKSIYLGNLKLGGGDIPTPPQTGFYTLKSIGGTVQWFDDTIILINPDQIQAGDNIEGIYFSGLDFSLLMLPNPIYKVYILNDYALTFNLVSQDWLVENGQSAAGGIGFTDYGGEFIPIWRFDTGWQPSFHIFFDGDDNELWWDLPSKRTYFMNNGNPVSLSVTGVNEEGEEILKPYIRVHL
jgi:hypothetical protein